MTARPIQEQLGNVDMVQFGDKKGILIRAKTRLHDSSPPRFTCPFGGFFGGAWLGGWHAKAS